MIMLLFRIQPTFIAWIIVLVSILAFWEIISEIYTIYHAGPVMSG